MKILTLLTLKESEELNNNKRVYKSDFGSFVHKDIIDCISEELCDNTGYEGFILGISQLNYMGVSLKYDYEDLEGYFSIRGNSLAVELDVSEELTLSIPYDKFLYLNTKYIESTLNTEKSYIKKLLKKNLKSINYYTKDNDDIITVVPRVSLADCKSFIMIDENWGAKDYRLGNAEQIKVKKLFIDE